MKTLTNKPYRGFRKLVDRYIDTVIYLLILAWIVALTASVAHLGHEMEALEEQIDILTETIDSAELMVFDSSIVLNDTVEETEEIDKPEYHVEATWPELYTDEDVVVLTKMLYGEALGVPELNVNGKCVSTKCQQAAVIWTVLNRYDAGYSDSITKIVKAPKQFVGYRESNPIDEELMDLVKDVLDRWNNEKHGKTDVGRVLPADYLWFRGDGKYNHFRNEYEGGTRWMWEMEDIYEG